ncbi:MAG TPA: alginate export family protein, partial [Gemmatimonadales bacterium]|nr:alginate export family protein [Gemmatimonadales bacterium]
NARAVSSRAGGVPGLQAEGEYAHQWNTNFPMSANAWYVQLGYVSERRAWKPNLSYRFGFFQGDDAATPTYERFDAPQSSGSDNWLQGNILRKTVVNSNVLSHRVRLGLSPAPGMNLVLSWFHLRADERNNRGGAKPLQELQGDTFGDEVDVTFSWGINRHLFLLGFAGIAIPGDAIDRALAGDAKHWRSFQLSLFWNL